MYCSYFPSASYFILTSLWENQMHVTKRYAVASFQFESVSILLTYTRYTVEC